MNRRRSFPADPPEEETRKLIADAATRRMPGRPLDDDEHTNFRPFQGAARAEPEPEVETRIPLHAPAAGIPAESRRPELTAFAPLTPERIQAQLDAAREARRMNRPQEAEGVFAPPEWGRGRVMESDPMPLARSMHASQVREPRERGAQPTVSWAFALAAMAIIGSVATVAIVEGSGDDLLRTGAEFVDPSMAHTDATPADPPKAATPSTQPISVMDLPPASPPPVVAVPQVLPPVVSPVPEPRPAVTASKPAPKAPRATAKGSKKSGASDQDIANAAAADALARAQLQQSM
ncbi:hypothetical protein LVJ94_24150 [Pendulispora rubella]|uniref:Uncharacterized protein n=1 Tax=Pendulispora rubella TaxID=2741070 RepID=A0ABZ2LH89_9BACT